MADLRSPRVRRVIALLLTWCFAFVAFEAPIADVHDGGATHAELDQITGASHTDHGGTIGDEMPNGSSPGPSDHPMHVCHCTHAHAGVLVTPRVELRFWEHAESLVLGSELTPPVVTLDPPTHPPIV